MTNFKQPKVDVVDFNWSDCLSKTPILCSRKDQDEIFTVIKIEDRFIFLGKTNEDDEEFDSLDVKKPSDIRWMDNNIKFIRYYREGDQLVIEA